jgi:hypothetical protein
MKLEAFVLINSNSKVIETLYTAKVAKAATFVI